MFEQRLTQNPQCVLQPGKELLTIHHGIAVLDCLHGMMRLQIPQEIGDFREHLS